MAHRTRDGGSGGVALADDQSVASQEKAGVSLVTGQPQDGGSELTAAEAQKQKGNSRNELDSDTNLNMKLNTYL